MCLIIEKCIETFVSVVLSVPFCCCIVAPLLFFGSITPYCFLKSFAKL